MSIQTTAANLFARVRQGREELIAFRRGDTTLAAQSIRVERRDTQAREADSDGASQYEAQAVVLGPVDLDVTIGDRFNDGSGTLYEVVHIRPNRAVNTQAVCKVIQ